MLRLSVRRRIFGGFIIVLSLLAMLSGVALHGMRSTSQGALRVRTDSDQAAVATGLALQVREAHARVVQYVLSSTMSDQNEAQASLTRLDTAIAQSGAIGGVEVGAPAAAYRAAVDDTMRGVEARRAAVELLQAAGTEIRTIISAIAQGLERERDLAVVTAGARLLAASGETDGSVGRLLATRAPADVNVALASLDGLQREIQAMADGSADSRRMQRFVRALGEPISRLSEGIQRVAAADEALRRASGQRDAAAAVVLRSVSELRGRAANSLQDAIAAMLADIAAASRLGIIASAGAIALGLLLAVLIGRGISRPITALTAAMQKLADGALNIVVPHAARRDELGAMARAVGVFRDHMAAEARLAQQQEEERRQAAQDKSSALTRMADTIETETRGAIDQVGQHTARMAGTADAMRASAARTGDLAQTAADAAAQALANAETVASTAGQLASSIREIGGQVSQATCIVSQAVQAGEATRATIEALTDKVGRIGAVADVIAEIAARTNLLALNATIEAARAGDAGKGFAVVANEVKQLASQTATSTAEIGRQIAEVRTATEAAVGAVGHIQQTIRAVDAISGSIAAAVEQQGAATAEITRNVTETAASANAMTQQISRVSAEAADTGRHAIEVHDDASGLERAMADLSRAVIRVVRSSTTEVDRRRHTRYATDQPCRILINDRSEPARLADVSEGGGCIVGGPAMHAGEQGLLELLGYDAPLPFTVAYAEPDALHVAFQPDAGPAIHHYLRRIGLQEAA